MLVLWVWELANFRFHKRIFATKAKPNSSLL
jgi:hypothetical protein